MGTLKGTDKDPSKGTPRAFQDQGAAGHRSRLAWAHGIRCNSDRDLGGGI